MTSAETKTCTKCKKCLPTTEFYKREGGRFKSACRTCTYQVTEAYRLKPGIKDQIASRVKHHRRKRRYGVEKEQYEAMFAAQNGCCALCDRPEQKVSKGVAYSLAVDHDHETGLVRQLLCHSCNTALGNFQDNPELLRRAAAYIEQHKNRVQNE